jgi:hypothetical protein
MKIRWAILGTVLLVVTGVGRAASSQDIHVTEIEAPLGCVDTVVTKSVAPTGPAMADGGIMAFRNYISTSQKIRELYIPPGDEPIANAGDRVRVCLLSIPKKGAGCDPTNDSRGREFLVYNRDAENASDNAAIYTNAEHWCGGA